MFPTATRTIRVSCALLVAAFCLFAAAPLSAAPARPTRIIAGPGEMLALANKLAKDGQTAKAEQILLLLADDPDRDVRNEARFRLALLREAVGRDADAAVLLRRILDDKPDASAVRIRLAMLLQRMGDLDAAHRELRAVRVTDLPPTVARFVDRLAASAQSLKPVGFQLELALAPDSNINRASQSDTVETIFGDFELGEEAKSGIGAAVRGSAHARWPLASNTVLLTRVSGEARIYRDRSFNDIILGVSSGPEFSLRRMRVGAEVGVYQQWYGMHRYQRTFRVSGSAIRWLGDTSQLRIDAAGRFANDQINNLRDGRGATLLGRYERAMTPRLSLIGSVAIDRFKARAEAYSTWSWSAGIIAYRELGRMTVNVGVDIGALRSDERLAILLEKRDDRFLRLHTGAVFRQLTLGGFAPVARLVFERNQSSVEFYDYKRVRTEFGISRAF
jgi:hypothetical protein